MLNKIISFFIIIWVIIWWYFYYNYKYIPEKQKRIEDQLKKQEQRKIEVEKAKNELKLTKLDIKTVELTNEQKIEQLKEDKSNYKTFNLKNASKVYFKEVDNKLDLYVDRVKIWNFDLVYPEFLKVTEVHWSLNDLYIEVGKNKFYYNVLSSVISWIDLNIDIKYIKKLTPDLLIFVTDKWSFTYSNVEKKLEYFTYFNDFVYYNDSYIWLVKKDESRVLNNLWFDADSDLIVLYNSNTKDKKILYKPDIDVQKIYMQNDKLYLSDKDWKIYELENIASNL